MGGAYLVCTMVISGLTHHPSTQASTHTHTHPQRAITLPGKTRPINSSPLSRGMELHLIQLLCHSLFTLHTQTLALTTCIRKNGTNKPGGKGVKRWGVMDRRGGQKGGYHRDSELSNRSQSIALSHARTHKFTALLPSPPFPC